MKLIKILGLFMLSFWSAQNTRFVYQVSMATDTTNLANKTVENAYLDVDGKKSYFYSEKNLQRDSIMERMRTTRNFSFQQMENFRSKIDYVIQKDIPNQNILFKIRIGRDSYSYTEKPDFSWKILPETATIGEYKTQKAETQYGGRTWYAWFTPEIPVQDGPYKFSGLPGLIVKVQDQNADFSFDLMQTKKISRLQEPSFRGQTIEVKKSKFLTLQKDFQKDPSSFFNSQRSGGGGFGGPRGSGGGNNGIAPPAPPGMDANRMKEMQQRMLEEVKSNNNPIELK